MRATKGLGRRAKIGLGIFMAFVAMGAMQGCDKPTKVDTSNADLSKPDIVQRLHRTETTLSDPTPITTATTKVVTAATVPPVTAAPTTSKPYVAPTTAKPYVAPTTAYVTPPTQPPQNGGGCHPSYDPCIPDTGTDVDCAGGSGNGPRYVQGPVSVHGYDEYDLDRDGDGVACES